MAIDVSKVTLAEIDAINAARARHPGPSQAYNLGIATALCLEAEVRITDEVLNLAACAPTPGEAIKAVMEWLDARWTSL